MRKDYRYLITIAFHESSPLPRTLWSLVRVNVWISSRVGRKAHRGSFDDSARASELARAKINRAVNRRNRFVKRFISTLKCQCTERTSLSPRLLAWNACCSGHREEIISTLVKNLSPAIPKGVAWRKCFFGVNVTRTKIFRDSFYIPRVLLA